MIHLLKSMPTHKIIKFTARCHQLYHRYRGNHTLECTLQHCMMRSPGPNGHTEKPSTNRHIHFKCKPFLPLVAACFDCVYNCIEQMQEVCFLKSVHQPAAIPVGKFMTIVKSVNVQSSKGFSSSKQAFLPSLPPYQHRTQYNLFHKKVKSPKEDFFHS